MKQRNRMKKIAALAALCIFTFAFVPVGNSYFTGYSENVALGKNISTPGTVPYSQFSPEMLVDGDITTGWSSGSAQHVILDLGENHKVSRVEVVTRQDIDDPAIRGGLYVYASTESSFEMGTYSVLARSKAGELEYKATWRIDVDANKDIRYLKVGRSDGYTFLAEIRVFGKKSSETTKKINLTTVPDDAKKQISLLSELSIMECNDEGDFELNELVSRAAASKLIVKTINAPLVDTDEKSDVFTDVPDYYWGKPYIMTLKALGIVNGATETTFDPERKVTGNEFIKMLVEALGHGMFAEKKGGYPYGYIFTAKDLDILPADLKADEYLSRKMAAKIIYNALNSQIAFEEGISGDNILLSVQKDKTVLSEMHDITKGRGRITATEMSDLINGTQLDKNQVVIDGVLYDTNGIDTVSYLGYDVTYYLKNEGLGTDAEIVLIEAESSNHELTVKADDIDRDNRRFSMNTFCYYNEKGKSKTADIAEADIIYNGCAYPGARKETLKPEAGNVRLLDYNGDNRYDVVFVNDYDDYVVARVQSDDAGIYMFDDIGRSILFKEDNSYIIKDINGEIIAPTGLEEGDVVSLGVSKKGNVIVAVVVNDKNSVIIEGIGIDGGFRYLTSESGDEYKIAKSYEDKIISDKYEDEIIIGKKVEVCFNADHEIAKATAVSSESSNYSFGYLIEAGESGKGLTKKILFKILTTNNKTEIFSKAEKFKLNREKIADNLIIENLRLSCEDHASDPTLVRQLVKYKTDDKGEITELLTPGNGLEGDYQMKLTTDRTAQKRYFFSGPKAFYDDNETKMPEFYIKASATVIEIPKYNAGYIDKMLDEKYYKFIGVSGLGTYKSHDCRAYNGDSLGVHEAVVTYVDYMYSGATFTDKLKTPETVLVSKISGTVDEVGDDVKVIMGYSGKKEVSYKVSTELDLQNLTFHRENSETGTELQALGVGDVIRVETVEGTIENADIIFKANATIPGIFKKNWGAVNVVPAECGMVNGYIVEFRDGYFSITVGYPSDSAALATCEKQVYEIPLNDIFVYSSASKKLKKQPPSISMLYTYNESNPNKVMILTRGGIVSTMVIVE